MPGSDPGSPPPRNQKQKQLRVEWSQMKDVAYVSPLPSSFFASSGHDAGRSLSPLPPVRPAERDDRHRAGRWHCQLPPAAAGKQRLRHARQEQPIL